MRHVLTAALSAVLFVSSVGAETIVTESGRFRVHFQPGARETAKEAAIVAEEVWYQLVTAFELHEEFAPIDILITDDIDVGNGYADYYQNQVVIWATNLNTTLRGTHRWLRDVVAHEVGHVFSLKLAKKYPFRYGLIQASVLNSSTADIGVSFPVYSLVTPGWWVEGIAQYEAYQYGGDWWDTHRDMLLRMATLEDDLLTYDDMGVFAHNWLKSEMIYNQGFALTRYIGERFGEDAPRVLAKETGYVTFNTALRNTIGMNGSRLYDQWTADLTQRYEFVADSVGAVVEGVSIADEGSYDWSPTIAPDGLRIAWISNNKEDYLITQPRIRHLGTGQTIKIDKRVYGDIAWFPSGDKVVYTKFGRGTLYLDLYVYDIVAKEERRISSQLRAREPAVSPDGEWIAFISTEDGGNRLGMVRSDGSELRWLTNDRRFSAAGKQLSAKTSHLVQLYTPSWSPDGKHLLFSVFKDADRDIAMISTDGPYFSVHGALSDSAAFPDSLMYPPGAEFRIVAGTAADERDPAWLPDGSGFLYAADYGGIFNIYRYAFSSAADDEGDFADRVAKITNVIGGAFRPSVAPDGSWIAYVSYHANNFAVYRLPLSEHPYEVASIPRAEERDYLNIARTPSAAELFHVGPTMPQRTLVGWVPIVRFGPNFIGDEFTVNHIGAGVAAQIDDQSNGRMYYGDASVTKNLTEKDPPSIGGTLYASQALRPINTTEWTLRPNVYTFGSYFQVGTANDQTQQIRGYPPAEVVAPTEEVIPISQSSTVLLTDTLTVWDNYRYLTGGIGSGVGFGKNRFDVQFLVRQYRIEELVDRKISNESVFRDARDTDRIVTNAFPWASFGWPTPGLPVLWEKQPQFNVRYFNDRTVGLSYAHSSITPTVDMMVNPTGGHQFTIAYRLHNVTLADSLAPSGYDSDDDGIPDLYDPTEPYYRGSQRNISINEIVASWRQYIRMPGPLRRHTLVLYGMVGYMDQPLKYYDPDGTQPSGYLEGWAYWPLRYRLGGAGTLRGYPYFSHEGSKVGFFRVNYVMPLIPHYGVQFLNLYHDRTYLSLFVEGGSTWNWEEISKAKFYRNDFLWDIGAELRTSLYAFYRLPVAGYVTVARRMKDLPYPFVDHYWSDIQGWVITQPSRYRIYVGLGFGFGGSGHSPASGAHGYHGAISRPAEISVHTPAMHLDPTMSFDPWSTVSGTPTLDGASPQNTSPNRIPMNAN